MKYFFKIYRILFLILFVFGLSSCSWMDRRAEVEDKRAEVDRTILIYMAANNNLSGNATSNLDSLKSGYIPDYFEAGGYGGVILVYYHNPSDLLPDKSKRPPCLLRISKDKDGKVKEEVILEYDKEQNSADISTLKKVLEDSHRLFPSEDNGLFLWSHGTGWLPKGFYSKPIRSSIGENGKLMQMSLPVVDDPMRHLVKSFGNDYEDTKIEMEMQDLADALPIKYSFILFDACLMGGVEVVYELKDNADYIISSAAEILAAGFPYHKIMTHIFEEKSDLEKVCDEFVDFYNAQASETSRSATISLVETSKLEELAAASAIIFNKNRANIETLSMDKVQRYFRYSKDWFYDLDDYVKNISGDSNDYKRFSSAMEDAVIYKKSTPYFFFNGFSFIGDGFEIDRFSGISTYIPNPNNQYLEDYYKTLSWNIDTQMIK